MDTFEQETPSNTATHHTAPLDSYRPGYHFTPPEGWMNDPNGLVYFAGEYHLFYQYRWQRHWGHAISTDLIHWTHLPVALEPDELGDIWSGNAVVDAHDTSGFFGGSAGLVAIFTHWKDGAQDQSIAYSSDSGRTWTKYQGNPVIHNPGLKDFRDPKVFWHVPTGRWAMVIAAGDRVQFYVSPNLRTWEYTGDFQHPFLTQLGVYECPDLFELPVDGNPSQKRWVLQISITGVNALRVYHLLGSFDGQQFHPDDTVPLTQTDYGLDSYAHASWPEAEEPVKRRICISWMNNWQYADRVPTAPWQGAMTIPRELDLVTGEHGLYLRQRPVSNLEQLRKHILSLMSTQINSNAPVRPNVHGEQLELIATFHVQTARTFGLRVRVGEKEHTTISYNTTTETLLVDRTQSGHASFAEGFACCMEAPLALDHSVLRLHVLLDRCSLEVFANDGRAVITSLIFPDPASDAIEVYADDGTVELQSLEVYELVCSTNEA